MNIKKTAAELIEMLDFDTFSETKKREIIEATNEKLEKDLQSAFMYEKQTMIQEAYFAGELMSSLDNIYIFQFGVYSHFRTENNKPYVQQVSKIPQENSKYRIYIHLTDLEKIVSVPENKQKEFEENNLIIYAKPDWTMESPLETVINIFLQKLAEYNGDELLALKSLLLDGGIWFNKDICFNKNSAFLYGGTKISVSDF